MLRTLIIKNFAIIENIHLEFENGLSVITGETGAGKSILFEALSLVLGQRSNTKTIKDAGKKLSVSSDFEISDSPKIKQWLTDNDLDNDNDCILQRTVDTNARSRAYINQITVPLAKLKELGNLLIDIVGQNTHQFLLSKKNHLVILDTQCNHQRQLDAMKAAYQKWSGLNQQIKESQETVALAEEKIELLKYQIRELEEFAPQAEEFPNLDQDHKRLSKIESLLEIAHHATKILSDDEKNICLDLAHLIRELEPYQTIDPNLNTARAELETALTHLTIADDEVKSAINNANINPQDFQAIENRLSKYLEIAKKYQVPPGQLAEFYRQKSEALSNLSSPEVHIQELQRQRDNVLSEYHAIADKVSQQRQTMAKSLAHKVSKTLHQLNMPSAVFSIDIQQDKDTPGPHGYDEIEFVVATNVGQDAHPMIEIVSGGELSRINLAIQTSLDKSHPVPTMIFDEVDTGVGGKTAETIGELLLDLANNIQLLCITHLPQIAAYAQTHYYLEKTQQKNQVTVKAKKLTQQERSHELARMLAGTKVSDSTLAHAREILNN